MSGEPHEPRDILPRPIRLLLGATGRGVSDERLRKAIGEKVVLVTGASSGVGKATRGRLARHKVPEEISFVEQLTRTSTGKLQRRRLARQYEAETEMETR
jgi:acyl-CoA synthetase (AMP-forming)/AMP-acid ligase II